jgi:tetratricopeptide (TPR) repeat protein
VATQLAAEPALSSPYQEPVALESEMPAPQRVSQELAEEAFSNKEYAQALQYYRVLHQLAKRDPTAELMADFFCFRIAQCLKFEGELNTAMENFDAVSASRSPVLCGVANYELAVLKEYQGDYVQARMRAYRSAMAYASVYEHSEMEMDADFLIARVLTARVLSFYGEKSLIPWSEVSYRDPFEGLKENTLRDLLNKETARFSGSLFGPTIEKKDSDGVSQRWTASAWRASVEEILTRFALQAGLDLRWENVEPSIRQRPVSMYLPDTTGQRLCELAAGSSGLIARFTGEGIRIDYPPSCTSLNEQRDLIVREAVSVWRRLFLKAPQDGRLAQGYFALGLIHEISGQTIEAINDYHLTVRQYARTNVAPISLLRASKLLSDLRDYSGARSNLNQLLDSYPDSDLSGQAYLVLGEATLKAGLYEEAFQVFKKLYFLEINGPSRAMASFGAGKCLYKLGNHEESIKWLSRYIEISGRDENKNLNESCFLLGKSSAAINDHAGAIRAFARVAGNYFGSFTVQATLEKARSYRELKLLGRAAITLNDIPLSGQNELQHFEILQLGSQVYREMGLPEKATSFLRGKIDSISNEALRAQLGVEMARSYWQAGQLGDAYSAMAESLILLPSGSFACEAGCDLAEICLELGKPDHALTVAKSVLEVETNIDIRDRAIGLVGRAYLDLHRYEDAALAASSLLATSQGGEVQP